ncbi:nuclease-related domain-containing DEAD/DEAH box helicase [Ktedonobacter robiniae]|uniref:DNA helicase n=1 Tax=Ktedonobacter robiniae TaxID=2778365 RepID=A0ABQ3UTP2_9CHLR|nr:nuclease-related domain-containing DEAD/DEAH box helicase [Ktedonobacter robiniae]GHO56047.1 DNA helicase [Ktedonobacter robiniae]
MPKIIPARGLDFTGAGGRAERQALEALKELPDEYYILRECKFLPSAKKQAHGSQEDRADFIVIGPELGILVLEVKDWNIKRNEFKLTDQVMIDKIDRQNGTTISIKNPWYQAEEYAHALQDLLKIIPQNEQLWINHAVVFPGLNRVEFKDVFVNPQPYNPQTRWQLDLNKTLFKDDIANKSQCELLNILQHYIKTQTSANRISRSYTQKQIEAVIVRLIPAEMRVGGLPEQNEATQKLAILDEEQQKWAISKAFEQKHYLSDVAGSGKTNVLLSRAIYQAKQRYDSGGCRILITTYNTALKYELERIFKAKIKHDPLESYYERRIRIYDIVTIMEEIIERTLQGDFAAWQRNVKAETSKTTYEETRLPQECIEIIAGDPHHYEIYDYLYVDEVQDFSTAFLTVVRGLLKEKKNFFAVGDIGQRIFDRTIEWLDFDIGPERVGIQSRFLMYRSPQPVAKLAWKFLMADPFIRQELVEEKYETKVKPKSPIQTHPCFISFSNEDELLQNLVEDIEDYLHTDLPRKILCIGLKDGLLTQLQLRLAEQHIPARLATETTANSGDFILLADYIEAKGLERDYVFIVDADHLARPQGIVESDEQYEKKLRKDRIKLFIALTRAIRTVRIYYINQQHPFIREINQL